MSLLGYRGVVGDSVQTPPEAKVDDIHISPLVHRSGYFITKCSQVVQPLFTYDKSMLTVPDHLLPLEVPRSFL